MNLEELMSDLKKYKNDNRVATKIINEINKQIENKEIVFNKTHTNELYTYMFLCNRLEIKDTLNKLINDIEFINVLDQTKIDGSILPSLTDICDKPRKCLVENSKKLKQSILKDDGILSAADIIADLTLEEVKLLRNDIDIDNYLISHGLSFSTLKQETIDRLLSEPNVFRLYNIYTINEFANSYKQKLDLINNDVFLNIYIEKLNDKYHYDNKLFKSLTLSKIKQLIDEHPTGPVIMHLLKDTKEETQKFILANSNILEEITKSVNDTVLARLPKDIILKVLSERKSLLKNLNLEVLDRLDKKDIQKLFKENKRFYEELVQNISNQAESTLTYLINSLPEVYIVDLCDNKISTLDLKSINKLLKTENDRIRKEILKNTEICTNMINKTTTRSFHLLEDILKTGKYTSEEIIKIINNLTKVEETKVLNRLVNIIPESLRKNIYENNYIREKIYKEEETKLDNYAINHLLNNIDELKKQTTKVITTVLANSDFSLLEQVLNDEDILKRLFNNQEATNNIIDIINANKNAKVLLRSEKIINLYTIDNINTILKNLTISEKNNICTNDLIKRLLNNNEQAFIIYKKLSNNNKYLLNTLNFELLTLPKIDTVKIQHLEYISKYPSMQDSIIKINKVLDIIPNFIDNFLYNTSDLNHETISNCLKIIADSAIGEKRKYIGNIPKMISTYNEELTKEEYKSLITYLLYLIPHYKVENKVVERPVILKTPSSFLEIISYEEKTENKLTDLIMSCPLAEVKRYFVMKHFKLSLEEASLFTNMYSIERIDNTIYKTEYELLDRLNKILNTDPESLREIDSMYESLNIRTIFTLEKQIKEMYGKIFNYEIRSRCNSSEKYIKTIYGKELLIYNCPNDFLFLISNMDITEEYEYTNSYFESWHNTLNKSQRGLSTSLISPDNFCINDDYVFGFNGILDTGILYMSNLKVCPNCKNTYKERYMTPKELIDNTRDYNNTITIDKYAIRPNYNNSNIPNIEPDFILVNSKKLEDRDYLEKISRASEEFKTKRNKNGLPIIAYDMTKIVSNELSKIKSMINKYLKTYDMNLLLPILTKIENNYTAYRNTNLQVAYKFTVYDLINIIKDRITKTNSISELEYIEEVFSREYLKYSNLVKELNCNYYLKELIVLIKDRKDILNSR